MGESEYIPQYNSSCVKWVLGLYIFCSNLSLMIINLLGLDKYERKHTGSQTNVQANIGKKDERTGMEKRTGKICELYVLMA